MVAKLLEDAMENYNANVKIDRRFEAIDSTKYGEITFKVDHRLHGVDKMKVDDVKVVDDADEIYNLTNSDDETGEKNTSRNYILFENQTESESEVFQMEDSVDEKVDVVVDDSKQEEVKYSGTDEPVDEIKDKSTSKKDGGNCF